jgi:hypothetical protein
MNNSEMLSEIGKIDKVILVRGWSRNKIHAVNRDLPYAYADIIITFSDDMYIEMHGLDSIIAKEYEDGFRGLLHIPDNYAGIRLCTLPIMHAEYYKKDGYVYYPGYVSVYADNEQQDVAIMRGDYKLLPIHGAIIHKHPIAGYGEQDALSLKTEDPVNYAMDAKLYHERKSINFGLYDAIYSNPDNSYTK